MQIDSNPFSPSKNGSYQITRIPAFSDNYLWLLDNGQSAIVVDPGDAQAIINHIEARKLSLDYILTTHHHPDHTGGVTELAKRYNAEVIGPNSQYIPQVTRHVDGGQTIELLGLTLNIITVPGHTLDHIAYFIDQATPLAYPVLFCGDTLFAGGCGRVFEGSFAQMRSSLAKLKALPSDTRIYCAHEYTQSNLAFALAVEPGNTSLRERVKKVASQRASNEATVPSTLATELATNPFLRYDADEVIATAMARTNRSTLNSDEVFGAIREWKDNF